MVSYKVRLLNDEMGLDRTIEVPEDQYILDIAEEAGIRLPAGCLQGECSVCVAKLVEGQVNQREQKFLRSEEVAEGWTVTCIAYPISDCTLKTHQEKVLYQNSLYYQSGETP
jgi:ferredoxin